MKFAGKPWAFGRDLIPNSVCSSVDGDVVFGSNAPVHNPDTMMRSDMHMRETCARPYAREWNRLRVARIDVAEHPR